jgi:hypothetical protein
MRLCLRSNKTIYKGKMMGVLLIVYLDGTLPRVFVGLAYQGKDIVIRFIIEYIVA